MHTFVVHLNEIVCRKSGRLGLDQVFRRNYGLRYWLNLIHFLTFERFSSFKESFFFVLVWWGKREKVCILEIILGDRSGCQLQSFPTFNKDIIDVGWHEILGSMIPHPVNSCITIHFVENKIWINIVGLIVYRNTCIQDKSLDVVTLKDVQCPFLKISARAIIEEHLVIEWRRESHRG